jgi:hypothetical protein
MSSRDQNSFRLVLRISVANQAKKRWRTFQNGWKDYRNIRLHQRSLSASSNDRKTYLQCNRPTVIAHHGLQGPLSLSACACRSHPRCCTGVTQ